MVNQILTSLGKNPLPFSDSVTYESITLLITTAVAIYTAWKNNSVTKPALMSDKIKNAVKNGALTAEQVAEFIDSFSESEGK